MISLLRRNRSQQKKHQDIGPNNIPIQSDDFFEVFFSLIAEGVKLRLLEAMFNLNVFALFQNNKRIRESELIHQLNLAPKRAQKWLYQLCWVNLLTQHDAEDEPSYELAEHLALFVQNKGLEYYGGYFKLYMESANEDLTGVLRHAKPSTRHAGWSWPPATKEQSLFLEQWMKETVAPSIQGLLQQVNFSNHRKFLDVGGGDGTLACALVKANPHLQGAVYNLPTVTDVIQENISSQKLSASVSVVPGNFLNDTTFPQGFDLILFTRVLFDWDPGVCEKLLKMAYKALPKNGMVVICELFKDEYKDVCFTCEYRYLFIDAMKKHLMKYSHEYRHMLENIGFTIVPNPFPQMVYCSVLMAQKL